MENNHENYSEEKIYCNSYDCLVDELAKQMDVRGETLLPKKEGEFDYEDINSWIGAVQLKDQVPDIAVNLSVNQGRDTFRFESNKEEMVKNVDEEMTKEGLIMSMAMTEAKMKVIAKEAEEVYPAAAYQIEDYKKMVRKMMDEVVSDGKGKESLKKVAERLSVKQRIVLGTTVIIMLMVLAACNKPVLATEKAGDYSPTKPQIVEVTQAPIVKVTPDFIEPTQTVMEQTKPAEVVTFEPTIEPTMNLSELAAPERGYYQNIPVEAPIYALTIDDGYDKDSMEEMLSIMESKGVNGTFFIIGSAAEAELGSELMKRIVEDGNEIGYHTMGHNQEAIKTWTAEDWNQDYQQWCILMKELLGEELYAKGVKDYARSPGGLFNGPFLQMARENGLLAFGWNTSPDYWESGVRPHGGDINIMHVKYEDIANLDKDTSLETIQPVTLTELIEESLEESGN